jgi:hypothetical protein
MGASFGYRVFEDKDGITNMQKLWDSECRQSRIENGSSYSGSIGMLKSNPVWKDKGHKNKDDAMDFVCDNHSKWEAPIATSFSNEEGLKMWIIGGWCSS